VQPEAAVIYALELALVLLAEAALVTWLLWMVARARRQR